MVSRAFMGGVGGVLLAALGVLVAARMMASPKLPSEPSPVVEREERPVRRPASSGFLGVIVAEEAVDISPRFEGRLEDVKVQVGDRVRRGEVVATLEVKAAARELAVAEAELLSARAELQVAELALAEAVEQLRRREDPKQLSLGALSQEELARTKYEQRMAEAKREGARARVLEHEARVARLQQSMAESFLRAPFDGLVASRYLDPGALARPGQTVVHLLREGAQRVRFAIPPEEARSLEAGRVVRVRVPEGGEVLSGQVAHVSPEVDVASRMILVVARLESATQPRPLPAGTVVRVEMPDGQ